MEVIRLARHETVDRLSEYWEVAILLIALCRRTMLSLRLDGLMISWKVDGSSGYSESCQTVDLSLC